MQNEKYDPLSIEKKWQKNWEQGNKFQPTDSDKNFSIVIPCLLYTSPSPRDRQKSRMPSSA